MEAIVNAYNAEQLIELATRLLRQQTFVEGGDCGSVMITAKERDLIAAVLKHQARLCSGDPR
jgi:hypothetical protein